MTSSRYVWQRRCASTGYTSDRSAADADSAFESSSTSAISQDKSRAGTGKYDLLASLDDKTDYLQYYKPWELQPEEEDRIKAQIQQAERDIEQETEQFEGKVSSEKPETAQKADDKLPRPEEEAAQPNSVDTVGPDTDKAEEPQKEEYSNTNTDDHMEGIKTETEEEPHEASKDHNDDVGEVVEGGGEDTVIY